MSYIEKTLEQLIDLNLPMDSYIIIGELIAHSIIDSQVDSTIADDAYSWVNLTIDIKRNLKTIRNLEKE